MIPLRCDSISVRHHGCALLHDVSIEIGAGETVGIMGDRASVSGLFSSLAGRSASHPFLGRSVRARAGVFCVSAESLIPDLMTGQEWLRYRVGTSGYSPADRVRRVREAVAMAGLGGRLEQRVGAWPGPDVAALTVATEVTLAKQLILIDRTLDSCSDDFVGRFARTLWARTGLTAVVAGSDRVVGRVTERTIILERGRVVCDEATPSLMRQRVVELEVTVRALTGLAMLFDDVPGAQRHSTGMTVPLGSDRNAEQVLGMCRDRGIPVVASRVRPAHFRTVE